MKTLLQIVQDILNDIDSDEVNSIDDTVESQQVAQIVRTCYEEMMSNRNWPHTRKLVQLDGLSSTAKPNYLKLPENLKELVFVKYETQKQGDTRTILTELNYKYPDDFLRITSGRNSDNDNVSVITDYSGSKLMIYNDKPPSYWTSFDDVHLVCDAWDSSVDNTLMSSKSQCLAYIFPSWVHEDEAVPDLPVDAFSALIEEAKSTAFVSLKQMNNPKAEQKAMRQQKWLSRKAWRAKGGIRYPNFGRK